MTIRRSRALAFRARGLSDSGDATNSFPGAMASLSNLIPAPGAQDQWVPRPAATLTSSFAGFNTPAAVEALFDNANRIYGFIQSARFAGQSEPFIYDTLAGAFVTIAGVTAANTPASTLNTGDWTPPNIDQVGAYVMFSHPGFNFAAGFAFGWLDMSGLTSATVTGNTHTTTGVDNLSTNVLTAGWRPGMTITDSAADIPAGTRIKSIAANGLSLTLTAAATGTNVATTFTVAGGTFAAPLWAAGNLNDNPLPNLATWIRQYAGSACYAVNTVSPPSAAVVFSDANDPLRRSDALAVQVLTFDSAVPINCLARLGLQTITGGVAQSLIVFQQDVFIQQITGTPTNKTAAVSLLNDSVGTQSPNSVQPTPLGLLFAAPDGVRRIDLGGNISKTIGRRGMGVTTPMLFVANPGRVAAAYNESVYRISLQNGSVQGTPTQEYWYHEDDDIWSGPHTFPAAVICATETPHSFAMFAPGINAKLWNSNAYASLAATYVENGVQMTFDWQTGLLPDTLQMQMNDLGAASLAIAVPAQQTIEISVTDEKGVGLDQVQLSGAGSLPAPWGTMLWGTGLWGAGVSYYRQQHLNWNHPIVFKQAQIMLAGNCIGGLTIGNLYMQWVELGYVLLTETG